MKSYILPKTEKYKLVEIHNYEDDLPMFKTKGIQAGYDFNCPNDVIQYCNCDYRDCFNCPLAVTSKRDWACEGLSKRKLLQLITQYQSHFHKNKGLS